MVHFLQIKNSSDQASPHGTINLIVSLFFSHQSQYGELIPFLDQLDKWQPKKDCTQKGLVTDVQPSDQMESNVKELLAKLGPCAGNIP